MRLTINSARVVGKVSPNLRRGTHRQLWILLTASLNCAMVVFAEVKAPAFWGSSLTPMNMSAAALLLAGGDEHSVK